MTKLPITPDEFWVRMTEIEEDDRLGTEEAHFEADALMCSLLETLGYDQGVKVFCMMDKWYS